MDLHGKIMNIQKPKDVLAEVEDIIDRMGMLGLLVVIRKQLDKDDANHLNRILQLAFFEGHKQARHAAAELVSKENVCRKII